MSTTRMTAEEAIRESAATDTTITIEWSAADELTLSIESEGDHDLVDFWGTTDTGSEWRVCLVAEGGE